MDNQIVNGGVAAVMALIVSFAVVVVFDDTGTPLEPTHYCESRELKMYCARTTTQYCYPSTETRIGSKRCTEGWKEIPKESQLNIISPGSGSIHCTKDGCF